MADAKNIKLSLYPSVRFFCTPMRNLWHILGYSQFLMVPVASDSSSSREMICISLIHTSQNMQLFSHFSQSFHSFIGKKVICLRQRNLQSVLMFFFEHLFCHLMLPLRMSNSSWSIPVILKILFFFVHVKNSLHHSGIKLYGQYSTINFGPCCR